MRKEALLEMYVVLFEAGQLMTVAEAVAAELVLVVDVDVTVDRVVETAEEVAAADDVETALLVAEEVDTADEVVTVLLTAEEVAAADDVDTVLLAEEAELLEPAGINLAPQIPPLDTEAPSVDLR